MQVIEGWSGDHPASGGRTQMTYQTSNFHSVIRTRCDLHLPLKDLWAQQQEEQHSSLHKNFLFGL